MCSPATEGENGVRGDHYHNHQCPSHVHHNVSRTVVSQDVRRYADSRGEREVTKYPGHRVDTEADEDGNGDNDTKNSDVSSLQTSVDLHRRYVTLEQ